MKEVFIALGSKLLTWLSNGYRKQGHRSVFLKDVIDVCELRLCMHVSHLHRHRSRVTLCTVTLGIKGSLSVFGCETCQYAHSICRVSTLVAAEQG